MDHERAENIRVLVSEFLEKMGIPSEVSLETSSLPMQGEFVCHIRVSEGSNVLIGQHGANLEALQALIRNVVRRQYDGWAGFSLDVNEYFRKKSDALLNEAKEAELRAVQIGASITLRPMSAFERKCVHMAVADSKSVETESIGMGNTRRVVIKPKIVSTQQ